MNLRAYKMLLVGVIAVVSVAAVLVYSQDTTRTPELSDSECDRCHACEAPTARDACLKPCFRHAARTEVVAHDVAEAPDTIMLDVLASEYLPILFDHRLHAEMADMSENCATCHHYSPEGKIPPCRSCHPKKVSSTTAAQLDLKSAYHRQCLVCHSQWTHETACHVCHRPATKEPSETKFVRGNFTYPSVSVPVVKTYATSYEPAPMVTFQHVEHIELFEFNCVDCHQRENCRYCHDQVNRQGLSKSFDEVHGICTGCHDIQTTASDTRTCGECHDRVERSPVFHAIVGKTLPAYLSHVGCSGCHPERQLTGSKDRM